MIHRRVSAAQGGGEAAAGQTELAKLRTGRLLGSRGAELRPPGRGAREVGRNDEAPGPDGTGASYAG